MLSEKEVKENAASLKYLLDVIEKSKEMSYSLAVKEWFDTREFSLEDVRQITTEYLVSTEDALHRI